MQTTAIDNSFPSPWSKPQFWTPEIFTIYWEGGGTDGGTKEVNGYCNARDEATDMDKHYPDVYIAVIRKSDNETVLEFDGNCAGIDH